MKLVLLMWSRARWSGVPSGSCCAAWPGATLPSLIVKSARPAARAVVANQPPGPSAWCRTLQRYPRNGRSSSMPPSWMYSKTSAGNRLPPKKTKT